MAKGSEKLQRQLTRLHLLHFVQPVNNIYKFFYQKEKKNRQKEHVHSE